MLRILSKGKYNVERTYGSYAPSCVASIEGGTFDSPATAAMRAGDLPTGRENPRIFNK